MKNATLLMLLGLSLATLWAAETKTTTSDVDLLKQATEHAMISLSTGRTNETLADLFKSFWPFTGDATARGEKLASDLRGATSQMESRVGKRLTGRYEFLGTRRLGTTYLTLIYVQKYEYGGLLVEFMFYKGAAGWLLNNATWTPNPRDDRVLWTRENSPLPAELDLLKEVTEQVMKSLSSGQMNETLARFCKNYCIPGEDPIAYAESLASFTQINKGQIESKFGKSLPGRYEFLGAIRLGKTYATLVYVQKYEYAALPVAFLFYRGQEKWFLNNTSLADDAQADLVSLTVNEPTK